MDKPREECGIVGVYNIKDAAEVSYLCLHALQHRGQESAGIVVSDGKNVRSRKGMGLLSNIFADYDLGKLEGHNATGHVRYSTTGASKPQNTQPLVLDYSEGLIVVAHNGNLTNAKNLRDEYEAYGSIFQTSTDSEVVVHLMAKPGHIAKPNNIAHCLGNHIQGAYSFVFMTKNKMIAVRDPNGFRPLALGRLDTGYIVASETVAFDQVGAEFIREIEPGEMLTFDESGIKSEYIVSEEKIKPSYCIFEHVYFARPDSFIYGDTVHSVRKNLGRNLAREHPVDADVVIPIPDGGISSALGFSEASKIPFDFGFIRNHYVGRTFLNPVQEGRSRAVHLKHNIIKEVVKDKKVVLVDDSLVRGTTMKRLVQAAKAGGAKEVHLRIPCPPHKHPCFYGVDFATRGELMAANHNIREMENMLEIDSLRYISVDGLLASTSQPDSHYCTACFTGCYPIENPDEMDNKYRMEQGSLLMEDNS
ncbi:MAG: amidophosphoribosyltransferase [Planctomycetota bacterium]